MCTVKAEELVYKMIILSFKFSYNSKSYNFQNNGFQLDGSRS